MWYLLDFSTVTIFPIIINILKEVLWDYANILFLLNFHPLVLSFIGRSCLYKNHWWWFSIFLIPSPVIIVLKELFLHSIYNQDPCRLMAVYFFQCIIIQYYNNWFCSSFGVENSFRLALVPFWSAYFLSICISEAPDLSYVIPQP